jgi:endonuclease-8
LPEGHTLHRLARTLNRTFGGHVVQSWSPQGRFVVGAELIDGTTFGRAQAWGKHLLVGVEGSEETVHVHTWACTASSPSPAPTTCRSWDRCAGG